MTGNEKSGEATKYFAPPIAILLVMTFALNILGLSVPLAAQLIFHRIIPTPGSSTLPLVVAAVAFLAVLEGLVRLARSLLLLDYGRQVTSHFTKRLFTRIVVSDYDAGARGSARSLDYFVRIAQVSEKYSGRLLVGLAELMFLPTILILIFYISVGAGLLISACLLIGLFMTVRAAGALRRNALLLNRQTERRYRFLLSILTAIHPLKALGVEDFILRRYEQIQTMIARTSFRTAESSNKLMHDVLITNQMIIAVSLVYGAYTVSQGAMTLGAISAVVLLGGRLMAPLQRAVFIFSQSRDLCEAEDVLNEAFSHQPTRPATVEVEANNDGRMELRDLAFSGGQTGQPEEFSGIALKLFPGETIALSGGSEAAKSQLLRIMAGIIPPAAGEVRLNDQPIDLFPQDQLNRHIAYVPGDAMMFHGTIRDNITRFGEVSIDQALSVAAIMDLQGAINELPRGIDTQLSGTAAENISTGMRQQIAMLRALAFRPRIILLDNADRGLDRQGYAGLQRFIASIQGQATLVIVSDDRNLTAGAQRWLVLSPDGLKPDFNYTERQLKTYRSLKL